MSWFNRRKNINETFEIPEGNNLAYNLFKWLPLGSILGKDSKHKDYVELGYEGNVDVYSFISRCATLMGRIPLYVENEKGDVDTKSPLNAIISQFNQFQTKTEFFELAETFLLTTGNAIIYAPRIENMGNNHGKLMDDIGIHLMPTQHTDIIGAGWRRPVDKYVIEFNSGENIEAHNIKAEDVIHVRFPNLSYRDGQNFMGMSPLKAASDLINSQNSGYKITSNIYNRPAPIGALSQEDKSGMVSPEQKKQFEKIYKQKYANPNSNSQGIPLFVNGKVTWVPISYTSLQDLQIIPNSQEGRRALANIFHVPAQLFNDISSSTYNNMKEADKAIYVNRVIPDFERILEKINAAVAPAYGTSKIKPDYSEIPALQADKKDQATWMGVAIDKGVLSRNEGREILGYEKVTDKPEMDEFTTQLNTVSIEEALATDDLLDRQMNNALNNGN